MNLILDDLPDTLDGVEIQTDFRYWILFEQLMLDEDLSPLQKGVNALNLIYKGTPTATQGTALASLLWFFRCGKDEDRRSRRSARSGASPRRLYDYDQDAERIFASFWAVYGLDLNAVSYLHWWKFRAMFDALPDDSAIMRAIYWRSVDTSKLKGEEKKNADKKKKYYALRDSRAELQGDAVAAALMRGEDPAALLKAK